MDTLELATRLRRLDEAALERVIESHGLSDDRIEDYFDLAERMLTPDAVQRALGELDRAGLAALAVPAAAGETRIPVIAARLAGTDASCGDPVTLSERLRQAEQLCLLDVRDDVVRVYEPVRRRLAEWPDEGLPSRDELVSAPRPAPGTTTSPEGAAARAGTRAFATVTAVAEIVASLRAEPARELQRGGLAQPDERRLAAAAGREPHETARLLAVAENAGLVALEGREWLVTERALAWTATPTLERWRLLAAAWLDALPGPARALLAQTSCWGETLLETLAWERPASPGITQRTAALLSDADDLGLAVGGVATTPGKRLATGDIEGAGAGLAPLLPTEVGTVYVQHDLTLVAPGPLSPDLDSRLRIMADLEHRVPASTYRVTAASVNRAMALGETGETLREFLGRISLTGIPQPLDYAIAEASERHGRVRVAPGDAGGSVVRSDDGALLDTLGVDQALKPLGLHRATPWLLMSSQPRDVVYWALVEARYPAVAEERDGAQATPVRNRIAGPPIAAQSAARRLAARLLAARGKAEVGAQHAWAARQLEVAIRGKLAVAVTVRMPDGSTTERDFEPLGVSGGRVRGRDRVAGVERTFPLASVESVRPAG